MWHLRQGTKSFAEVIENMGQEDDQRSSRLEKRRVHFPELIRLL